VRDVMFEASAERGINGVTLRRHSRKPSGADSHPNRYHGEAQVEERRLLIRNGASCARLF
jgi:hypothetical protein